ncbi:phage antirepressor N-terminal domain-containing protein [Methylobacterium sp. NEAU 140]|uniref:phage antirepressor N-terminal domain-containing protein n=1 Tax=Methylobacterium sp. NEAU 140 TaxID=3064945 RepID=UPI002733B67B|nr:phage antirepressor N-terminal domain-containing protein [Methylobacterium sp. NEAU 140]MDP4024436.1 phage antirepressor N-terminal domain-containing protein [Methylobacterium sp. NEAU 140]
MGALITVPFRGDTLFAIREGETVRVALKPIADRLSLDWGAQLKRAKRDPILAGELVIMTIPSPGGPQSTVTLPLNVLPGWLFGIEASRVKPEARALVLTYQRECHEVLFRHFFVPREAEGVHEADTPDPALDMPTAGTKIQMVAECRRLFGLSAARDMWRDLGLPDMAEPTPQPAQIPPRESLFEKTERLIRQAPNGRIYRAELYRRFDRGVRYAQLDAVLNALIAEGRVMVVDIPRGSRIGRPPVVYQWAADHQQYGRA